MKYIEFKGAADKGNFEYDEKQEDGNYVTIDFPLKEFTIMAISYTIKGFDSDSKPIWSNDISKLSDGKYDWATELKVMTKANGTIFEGKYDKAAIEALGGKLHIKIEGIQNGEAFCLHLKGTNYFKFNQLLETINIDEDAVKFTGYTDEKNGAVKYRAPVFEKGGKAEAKTEAKPENADAEISVEDIPF